MSKHCVRAAACLLMPLVLAGVLTGCGSKSGISDADASKIAALETELTQLEAQVVESEDISAVKRLMRTYGYYVDKGLWNDLADLFAEDGVANYPSGVFVGKQSIHNHYFKNLGGGKLGLDEGQLSNYMILQPIVHIAEDGKTAHGRWRTLAMMGRYGQSATWAEGPYEVEYVKDNGVWKIKTLNYFGTFTSPYEDGAWGKRREGAGPAPRKMAHQPDKPRDNEVCPAYPRPCLAPFHYKNPVSGR